MYTYTFSKNFSSILNIEFNEVETLSDQELSKLPNDAIMTPHFAYSKCGTEAARLVNTGKKRPEHSLRMKELGIRPPVGSHKGHIHNEETRKLIGQKSGAGRLGKKRGPYKRNPVTCPDCGKHLAHASSIGSHKTVCLK